MKEGELLCLSGTVFYALVMDFLHMLGFESSVRCQLSCTVADPKV